MMVCLIHISLILSCCLHVRVSVATSPVRKISKLPDQFSLHQELVDEMNKKIAGFTEVFDYKGKVARMDMVPPDNSDLSKRFGSRPVTVISDFNTGHRYVIDRWGRNCTQTSLPRHSWVSQELDGTYVRMKHSYDVFDDIQLNGDYTYNKQTTVRNIQVFQYSRHSSTVEEDLFLLNSNWSSSSDSGSVSQATQIPVAHQVKTFHEANGKKELTSQQMYHIYDFYAGHPAEDAFDIGDCFSFRIDSKSLMFFIEGSYFKDVYGKHEQLYTAVRNAIATHAKVSPLRVTDVYITQSLPVYLDVTFFLRGHPKNPGNVQAPTSELSLQQAIDNLNNSIIVGFGIDVPYKEGQRTLEILTHSLTKPWTYYSFKSQKSSLTSYTPGQMAGLAIGMIILGFGFGIGAAYVIRKRLSTEVPYAVTT